MGWHGPRGDCGCCAVGGCDPANCLDGTTRELSAWSIEISLPDEIEFFIFNSVAGNYLWWQTSGWSAFNGTYFSTVESPTCFDPPGATQEIAWERRTVNYFGDCNVLSTVIGSPVLTGTALFTAAYPSQQPWTNPVFQILETGGDFTTLTSFGQDGPEWNHESFCYDKLGIEWTQSDTGPHTTCFDIIGTADYRVTPA